MAEPRRSVQQLDFTPQDDVFSSPADWRDVFVYFLLVDRFDNNSKGLRPYVASGPQGRDPAQGKIFQGGNLKGIMRRLDSIKGLGANAIWLSPILKNRREKADSYHGYGIQNFLEVDPRFGTKEDLQKLVSEAHARDMYVILDIILNHTGDNWAYPGDFPYFYSNQSSAPFDFGFWRENEAAPNLQEDDAVWPIELKRPECYKRRGQIRNWSDPEEAINGDFLSLKELDIRRTDVLDGLIKVYRSTESLPPTSTAFVWIRSSIWNRVRRRSFATRFASTRGVSASTIFFFLARSSPTIRHCSITLAATAGSKGPTIVFRHSMPLGFSPVFYFRGSSQGFFESGQLRARYERFKTEYADHGEAGQYFVSFLDNHDQMARPYRRFMHANPFPQQGRMRSVTC